MFHAFKMNNSFRRDDALNLLHFKLNFTFPSLAVICPEVRIFTQPQRILCYLKCRHISHLCSLPAANFNQTWKPLSLYLPQGRLLEAKDDRFAKKIQTPNNYFTQDRAAENLFSLCKKPLFVFILAGKWSTKILTENPFKSLNEF